MNQRYPLTNSVGAGRRGSGLGKQIAGIPRRLAQCAATSGRGETGGNGRFRKPQQSSPPVPPPPLLRDCGKTAVFPQSMLK